MLIYKLEIEITGNDWERKKVMNKNNFLSFPRQDGKSTKTMQLLFDKYCNSQTTITVEQAIDFIENKLEIKLLNYQKKILKRNLEQY